MNTPAEVLVDGLPSDARWPMDRGLLYGDGVFETMLARDGAIRFEAEHSARLAEGCRRLGIHADLPRIWSDARAAAARHVAATLRLQVTRGVAEARGYTPTGREQACAILAIFASPAPDELPAHIRVSTLTAQLGENPALAGLKHCNRLEQVLARQALQAHSGAFEGLMCSSSGALVSGTMSNVFLEVDGELLTPAIDRCGVAGVLRAVALREAVQLGIPVRITTVPAAAAARCSALALSNARLGLVMADELDGRTLAVSPRLRALAQKVAQL